ncbi:hypothetical protein QBA75_38850 [Streptomyces stelliscabiei]
MKTTARMVGFLSTPPHQPVQLFGEIQAELLVGSTVHPDDQDGSPVFCLQVTFVFVWHVFRSWVESMRGGRSGRVHGHDRRTLS